MDDVEFDRKTIEKEILTYLSTPKNLSPSRTITQIMNGVKRVDKEQITTIMKDLLDSDFLREGIPKQYHPATYQITKKGRDSLETIYNPEWIKTQEEDKEFERSLRIREVEASETSHRWTKIGVIIAIIVSAISIAVSISKP